MTLWRRKLLKIFKAWSRGESSTALAERPQGTGRAKSLRTRLQKFVNVSIFKVGFRTNGNALLISCGSLLCSLKNIYFSNLSDRKSMLLPTAITAKRESYVQRFSTEADWKFNYEQFTQLYLNIYSRFSNFRSKEGSKTRLAFKSVWTSSRSTSEKDVHSLLKCSV